MLETHSFIENKGSLYIKSQAYVLYTLYKCICPKSNSNIG